MDRNKLIRIIQKDLNELNEITDELAGKPQISALEIEFALGKARILCQEFDYLRELNQQLSSPEIQDSPKEVSSLKEVVDQEDTPEQENRMDDKTEEIEEKIMEFHDFEQDTTVLEKEEIREEEIQQSGTGKKTLAEIFIQEKSLNDSLSVGKTIDHKLAVSPLSKLEAAIGLNDRFLFIRELFSNDAGLFNQTVKQIDQMQNLSEAVTFLNSNFKWKKNETSLKFAQLVKRRFSK
ncbi:MAG: hypothetical protein AB2L24_07480 [Mangrovibacterium sp.]